MLSFTHRHGLKPALALGLLLTASEGLAADRFDRFSLRGPGTQSWETHSVASGRSEGRVSYARWFSGDARARIPIEPSPHHLNLSDAASEWSNRAEAISTNHGEMSVEQAAHTAVALTLLRRSGVPPLVGPTADGMSGFAGKRASDDGAVHLVTAPLVAAHKNFQSERIHSGDRFGGLRHIYPRNYWAAMLLSRKEKKGG